MKGNDILMRNRTKLLLTALTAAIAFAALVGTASATRLEINSGSIRSVWTGLKFSNSAGGLSVTCPVTLEGTLHSRTISKVSGSLVGFITRAIVSPFASCINRENVTSVAILASTLPWHVRYDSFTGTLPTITGVRLQLINAGFQLGAFGVLCLYKSTAARPAFGIATIAAGTVSGLRAEERSNIPKFEGGILCPSEGVFEGTGRVTQLGNTTAIRISLVR